MTVRNALTWAALVVLAASTTACGASTAAPPASAPASAAVSDGTGAPGTTAAGEVPADSAPAAVTTDPSLTDEPLRTEEPTVTEEPAATASDATSTASPTEDAKPLTVGDSGPRVTELQKKLLERGFWLPDADGNFGAITQQAVFAAQKTFGLPRTGLAGPMTMKALADGTVPEAQTSSGKAVEIDVERQTLSLVEDGEVKAVFNTSTGNGEKFWSEGVKYVATTPTGEYTVQSRNPYDWVKGPLGEMYKPVFFNGGIAFHGSAEIPPYPASHGCARLSKAAQDYIWSQGYASVGGTVVVH